MRLIDSLVARARALPGAVLERIHRDYAKAQGFVGYVKLRLRDKATWGAISAGIVAAGTLRPPYAAMTVIVAIVVALLPTP